MPLWQIAENLKQRSSTQNILPASELRIASDVTMPTWTRASIFLRTHRCRLAPGGVYCSFWSWRTMAARRGCSRRPTPGCVIGSSASAAPQLSTTSGAMEDK